MESLTSLRPHIVQSLLEYCNSVKVKRLFMYMSDQHNHPWLDNVNISRIDLGRGKRLIVSNGMVDKKYNITVPRTSGEEIA